MEVRIGVTHAARELSIETGLTPDELHKAVAEAVSGDEKLLMLADNKGRTVYVPTEKLSYIEIVGETGRRMGFGAL